jgi:type III restriction enzyme
VSDIELLDFQQEAASKLINAAVTYFANGQDVVGGRPIPFVGQLQAVTGAGKTPIIADVVARLKPAVVLWTTKFGSVVDQTVANLRGKYRHLLGKSGVEIINFGEITGAAQWEHLIERADGLTILVSTVGMWNSSEKDERLNVHRPYPDWGEKTRWQRLKEDRKRPLWVVYDEAHNTTSEQFELLDDLNPAGFFVASASQIKGKLQFYLSSLPKDVRAGRIIPVSTRAVVDAQLLKSTISLADYDSSPEEMILDVVKKRAQLGKALKNIGSTLVPKAIYVVETSNTVKGQEPRPTAIWRTLVDQGKVPVGQIAVCTNTKELPKEAVRVATIDQLSDGYTHIIFNKKLQEGWDDPSVYVCYFDGKTDSATRLQQVIGRAVRQPSIKHFHDEELNTAYFYVNCPNELLGKITDQLKEELRIYQGDDPEFEPFQFKEERKALPKIPVRKEWIGKIKVPQLQLEMPPSDLLRKLIEKKSFDFSEADRAAKGKAVINIVSVKTGEVLQAKRDLLEDMRVRCGSFLYESIRILSKNCCSAIHPDVFSSAVLDKSACFNSKALDHYRELARLAVHEYENHVRLTVLADAENRDYVVGPYQPTSAINKQFGYSGHAHYDAKAFRDDELEVAKALDKHKGYVWVRNKDRLDFSIPLPIKSGSSSNFYPDFIWKVKKTIWAIDPTGKFILLEKVRTKLMAVPSPLRIALITRGKLSSTYTTTADDGWSLLRFRTGNAAPETFDDIDDVLGALVHES